MIALDTSSFLSTARELAKLASQAYDDPPDICCATTDTQVIVREFDNAIVVAFRGTKGVRDFITDADFKRVGGGGDGVKFHRGFDRAILSVIGHVEKRLEGVTKPIYLTGHSLGGALAQLAAYVLPEWDQIPAGVYTFGQPRVGNAAFARSYDAKLRRVTFRFVHEEDIVPRIPWLCGLYRHAGHEIFLPSFSAAYIINPPLWRRIESDAWGLFNAWRGRRNVTFLDDLLGDHRIGNYIDRLVQLTDTPTLLPQNEYQQ